MGIELSAHSKVMKGRPVLVKLYLYIRSIRGSK